MKNLKIGLVIRTYNFIESFKNNIKGVAALEFAMIAPILILLFLGTYEISTAVSVNRKLARVSSTLGDLITQSSSLTNSDLEDIVKASILIMKPYDTPMEIQMNSIKIDGGNAKVDQSFAYKVKDGVVIPDTANVRAKDSLYTVPPKIKTDGSYLVAAVIKATHNPVVGFMGYENGGLTKSTAGIDMEQEIFLRPRIGTTICIGSSC